MPSPTTQTLNLEMRAVHTTNVQPKGAADSIVSTMIVGFSRITLHAIAEDHLGFALEGLLRHSLEILCINAQRVLVITKSKHVMRMGTKERSKRRIFCNGFVIGSYRNAVSFPYSLRVTQLVNDGAYIVRRTFELSFSALGRGFRGSTSNRWQAGLRMTQCGLAVVPQRRLSAKSRFMRMFHPE